MRAFVWLPVDPSSARLNNTADNDGLGKVNSRSPLGPAWVPLSGRKLLLRCARVTPTASGAAPADFLARVVELRRREKLRARPRARDPAKREVCAITAPLLRILTGRARTVRATQRLLLSELVIGFYTHCTTRGFARAQAPKPARMRSRAQVRPPAKIPSTAQIFKILSSSWKKFSQSPPASRVDELAPPTIYMYIYIYLCLNISKHARSHIYTQVDI